MAGPGNSINETTTGISGFTGTAFVGSPLTQYNLLVGSSTSSTIANIAPSATSGVPVISQGSSANPVFGTAVVAGGGTGAVSLTGVLTGNGTSAVTANAITQHGVLIAGASNAVSSLAVAATGTVLTGVTSSDPVFSATPTVTSVTFGSGSALNTYVAGSWTPVVNFGGASVGITYTAQVGRYTQIGNILQFICYIVLSSKGSSTGAATITGLPVSAVNTSNLFNSIHTILLNVTTTSTVIHGQVNPNSTLATLFGIAESTGTAQNIADTNFSNTTNIYMEGFYFTS